MAPGGSEVIIMRRVTQPDDRPQASSATASASQTGRLIAHALPVLFRGRSDSVAAARNQDSFCSPTQAPPGDAPSCRLRLLFGARRTAGHGAGGRAARRSLAISAFPGGAWRREEAGQRVAST